MRRFELHRAEDETGVSGEGRVAQGVEFDCGKVALTWLTIYTVVAVYNNMKEIVDIHGHKGKTRVVWLDEDTSNGEHTDESATIIDPAEKTEKTATDTKKKPVRKK